MGKSTHFFGQPIYGQLIKLLDKDKILQISRNLGGERKHITKVCAGCCRKVAELPLIAWFDIFSKKHT